MHSESRTYKLKETRGFKWKKYFFLYFGTMGALLSALIAKLLFEHLDRYPLVILFVIVFMIMSISIYRAINHFNNRVLRWNSYVITLTDQYIARDFPGMPQKKILKNEIKTLTTEFDGSIRINRKENNGIVIKHDIEGFEEIKSWLPEIKNESVSAEEPEIKTLEPTDIVETEPEAVAETMSSFTERLQQNISSYSVFSIVIIIGCYLKQHLYYSLYDIDIYNYLDASEIIFFFTTMITECTLIGIAFYIFHKAFSFIRFRASKANDQNNQEWTKIIFSNLVLIGPLVFLYIYPVDSIVFYGDSPSTLSQIVGLVFTFFIVCALVIVVFYILTLDFRFRPRLVTIPLTFAAALAAFILITISENRLSYKMVTTSFARSQVMLKLSNGDDVCTSKNLVYIGGTNGYIFFRDLTNSENLVIPRSAVISERKLLLRRGL